MTFQWAVDFKGLKSVANIFPYLKKKVHEIDHAETSLWISLISFIISFGGNSGEILI